MRSTLVNAVAIGLLFYATASCKKIIVRRPNQFDAEALYEMNDPDVEDDDDGDACSDRDLLELTEIKNDLRNVKSMMERVLQKLDPDFKMPTVETQKVEVDLCPDGFTYLPGAHSCYKAISKRHKWSNAVEQCQSLNPNSHLISINSPEESEAITKYLKTEFKSKSARRKCFRPIGNARATFWTSGQRINTSDCSSEFVWKPKPDHQSPLTYTNWAEGEPNCHNGDEKCAELVLGQETDWNDVMCYVRCCPLCEYDLE